MEDTLTAPKKAAVKMFLKLLPQAAGGEATAYCRRSRIFIVCNQKHRVCECAHERTNNEELIVRSKSKQQIPLLN